ncbi:uncharacterized protein N7515_006305 [Penicillium bovifimosum]|uniref:Uncharacterized protein n=1 Tax=Penicillium bovifimosum TaxID=126998 RepID=A0A9W9L0M0_9EURO|nr:uncharacterized protein N7515_006305 [Penicillium bovifimosum]KAJ5130266.1 hypothetical protein N7515_006305 [Penicillium bovifimosum]
MALTYPKEYEPHGDRLRRWMEDANEPGCPILRSSLTIPDNKSVISDQEWYINSDPFYLADDWALWAQSVGLPFDGLAVDESLSQGPSYYNQSIIKFLGSYACWIGRTGPGVIFIDNIKRDRGSTDPHMSEYAKAFYEMNFDLASLKYVVVTTIVEKETRPFLNHLYESRGLFLSLKEECTWEAPSAEFCGILGTPIGKMVGALILGAYGQGVKRIARIMNIRIGEDYSAYNLRFDIEDADGWNFS